MLCTGARLQKLARARATSPCLARSAAFLNGRESYRDVFSVVTQTDVFNKEKVQGQVMRISLNDK